MQQLTPNGRGGIAVVAAHSEAERAALLACLRTRAGARVQPSPTPRLCIVAPGGTPIDEGLLVDRGVAGLELHTHGSPAILAALARALPFQRESVDPATQLLRQALSPQQLELAIEQLGFDLPAHLRWLAALPPAERAVADAALRERSRVAMALARPHRLVIVGRQNAGKSTLMNRLLFHERVLTGPMPGLTRDPIRELTVLDGYPYELVDTAGEGPATSDLDHQAQQRARTERADADRLLVIDGSRGPEATDLALCDPRSLVLANKADLPQAPWPPTLRCDLRLSCHDPASASSIRTAVGALLRVHRRLPPAGPVGGPAALDGDQLPGAPQG